MSNSPLINYTKISPNKTHPRKHKIDTITIHCMAGNLSVETCGNVFAPKTRKASSNYGIGSDGRIALYVDEGDRSWCSSNSKNDDRAVTIEVANDGGANTGWHVSQQALSSLIALVTDICKRNGIPRLIWSMEKAVRVNHFNGANMTVHRDFANKACPGDYLYNLHGWIAEEVNKRLNGKTEQVKPQAVKVKVTSDDGFLNIRTNAGVKYGIVDVAETGDILNIYETIKVGSATWGRCDKGWVNLRYTKAV